MAEKTEQFIIRILGDEEIDDVVSNRYSFIDDEMRQYFSRWSEGYDPHFFIIDLDRPLPRKEVGEILDKRTFFSCCPILFVSFEANNLAIAELEKIIPSQIIDICNGSPPICKSRDELRKTLSLYRFLFKKQDHAITAIRDLLFQAVKPDQSKYSG
jgi:hypothetical protein